MARGAHKVHPVGFRLGINKAWKSRWYVSKKDYADTFLSDNAIREMIEQELKTAGVASIVIKRTNGKVLVEVHVARPGVVIGKGGAAIAKLKQKLEKLTKTDVEPKIFEVKHPEIIAKLAAQNIAMQCERRISPKIAMERVKQAAMETGKIRGIAIWVGGRVNGAEIARVEKVSVGDIPRHTLRYDIDYAFTEAQVPGLGKHGIKVWINKGEKNGYSID